jgi:hypothetical protein
MSDGVALPSVKGVDSEANYEQALQTYRLQLIDAEQRAQATFDRTVLTLSGGALGVSFAFVEKFTVAGNTVCKELLLASWVSWATSLALILLSHYCSTFAMRKAVAQVDAGTISTQPPGGAWDNATKALNALGAMTFVVGVVFICTFAINNLR